MKSFLTFMTERLLLESPFDDAKKKWTTVDRYNDGQVQLFIDDFKMLRDKNQLSGKEKDISYWVSKNFKEFSAFVRLNLERHEIKSILKAKAKDATKVFENENCAIFNINSYEASCKYGAGTKWCITGSNEAHWIEYYRQNHVNFFFIISKTETKENAYYKIAVSVYPEKMGSVLEIYDAEDSQILDDEWERILEEDGIPVEIFVPRVIIPFKTQIANIESIEGKIAKINEEWIEIQGKPNALEWTPDFKHAVIWTAKDLDDLITDYGNENAKNIINGDLEDRYQDVEPYEGNVEDCFDMLDSELVERYLRATYPDDEEEWEDGAWAFVKNQFGDDLYRACQYAAERGERGGMLKDVQKSLDNALSSFAITDADNDEVLDGAWIDTETKYNGRPVKVYASFANVIYLLSEEEFDLVSGGFGFKIEVDEPYNGFSGWDKDEAKEYLKDESEYGYMIK